ncbi:MAG: ShlB/FhaC/HecB family hemolysin secretion/activation protein [Marinicaulis sp.]|nr:ShlB/FhaC/HecB family hemolysin secretion/activation protein [Marinicaulis sp.]
MFAVSALAGAQAQSQVLREGPNVISDSPNDTNSSPSKNDAGRSNDLPLLRDGPDINSPSIHIREIRLIGASAEFAKELTTLTQTFEERRLTGIDLQRLANVLTRAYMDQGYLFSKAFIRPQKFENGEVAVEISEGYLSRVAVNGDTSHPLVAYFNKAMPQRPLRRKTFARALSRVQSAPGYRLIDREIEKDADTANGYALSLSVEQKKVQARLDVTNKGVRVGEPWRAFLRTRFNSVLRPADQLSLGYVAKPFALSELHYFSGTYQLPIGYSGLAVFVSGAMSDSSPRSALAGRNLNGDLRTGSIGVNYPIIQSNQKQLSASAKIDVINTREKEDAAALYNDRLRVFRFSSTYKAKLKGESRVGGFLQLSQGVNAFNASDQVGLMTSRPDADAQFLKLDGEASIQQFVNDRISFTASATGQYATSPLLYHEEFGVGGGSFGRGYDFGEILGDLGAAGYVEAALHGRSAGILDSWEIYSFVDAGVVWNKGTRLSADGDPLYSAGGGLRFVVGKNLFLSYEVAHPLSDAPYTLDDETTRHRLQLSVAYN